MQLVLLFLAFFFCRCGLKLFFSPSIFLYKFSFFLIVDWALFSLLTNLYTIWLFVIIKCDFYPLCRYELLFYPRYHLDQSSLLCRKPLFAKPMVMDVYQDYILVTYRPFDVHIFHLKLLGELTPSYTPDLQVKWMFYPYFLKDSFNPVNTAPECHFLSLN